MAYRHGARYLATGLQPKPGERPAHVYKTLDGKFISICCPEPWFWERLCRVLDLEQYIPYAEEGMAIHADTHYDEEKHKLRQEIIAEFSRVFGTKSRDEWVQILLDADICGSPVYDFGEVFSDPHVKEREMVVELKHPGLGRVRQVGIPIKLSGTPGSIRSFAPVLGENTEEILLSLGYSAEEISELVRSRVVKTARTSEDIADEK
jgi:formyl-CoA transferase